MTNKTELKPCPFCGSKDAQVIAEDNHTTWYVRCPYCGSQGEQCRYKEQAFKVWNIRFQEPSGEALEPLDFVEVGNFFMDEMWMDNQDANEYAEKFIKRFGKPEALEPLDEEELKGLVFEMIDEPQSLDNLFINWLSGVIKEICKRFGKPNIDEVLSELIDDIRLALAHTEFCKCKICEVLRRYDEDC